MLLAIAVSWIWVSAEHRPAEPSSSTSDAGSGEQSPIAVLETDDGSQSSLDRQDVGPSLASASVPSERLHLTGRVRFIDREGEHHPSARGGIHWEIEGSNGALRRADAWIQDDLWTLEVASDELLRPVGAIWSNDGRSWNASVEPDTIPAAQADGRLVVATLLYGTKLDVVDRFTRQHLTGITLLSAKSTEERYRELRYPPEVFFERASREPVVDSPILLPAQPGTVESWVRAPSHAWTRFAFRADVGELTIALAPGADVDLTVRHVPVEFQSASVQVFASNAVSGSSLTDRALLAERTLGEDGFVRLVGLPECDATIAVIPFAHAPFEGPRLGQVEAQLRAGPQRTIEIDLADPATRGEYGSLEVLAQLAESGRKISNMTAVRVERVDSPGEPPLETNLASQAPDDAGRYSASWSNLLAGEYVVSVVPQGLARQVAIEAGGRTQVEFAAPELSDVTVTLVDARDGRPLSLEEIFYRPAASKSGAMTEVPANAEREHHFRCARGTITLTAFEPGWRPLHEDVVLDAAEETFRFELQRDRKLQVRVRAIQAASEVQLPYEFWRGVRVRAVPPDDGVCTSTRFNCVQVGGLNAMDSASADYFVDRPGAYELEFPRFSGLCAFERRRVVVGADGAPEQLLEVEFE